MRVVSVIVAVASVVLSVGAADRGKAPALASSSSSTNAGSTSPPVSPPQSPRRTHSPDSHKIRQHIHDARQFTHDMWTHHAAQARAAVAKQANSAVSLQQRKRERVQAFSNAKTAEELTSQAAWLDVHAPRHMWTAEVAHMCEEVQHATELSHVKNHLTVKDEHDQLEQTERASRGKAERIAWKMQFHKPS